ncbi:MAG: aspartate--tRNA ligase, partial [Bdellovibrionales bacterium]|nr:aspartate--tRNA ligase [Bdellovibrionales bacterium]
EGARDFLVPSRVSQGEFYALPQSPQTLKQLLMIGGMDRYFQIARCFRDEDLRADRQPEFSQIDIEMSFVDQQDVMDLSESLLKHIWKEVKNVEIGKIPVWTFQEAMDAYGSDKPDLRNPLKLKDVIQEASGHGFKVFDDVASRGGAIKGLAVPNYASVSRGQIDKLTALAKQMGAKGLVWMKKDDKGLQSSIQKFFTPEQLEAIFAKAGGETNGAVFIVADDFEVCCAALSMLRDTLGKELGLIDTTKDAFLWVVDFPLLEYDGDSKRWAARHHPFTMCKDDQLELLEGGKDSDLKKVLAKAYDLVCNGHELFGGSVRIHQQKVQESMFTALGFSNEEREEKFGFFIEALRYGVPPHGGVAWGLDRLIMILAGTGAIRDVIAFPKTAKATCLMSSAPSPVARDQLLELGIRLAIPEDKKT